MTLLKLLPAILSALLLGAHLFRAGLTPLSYLVALSPLLLLVRNPWVSRGMQILLVLGALEWVRTVVLLVGRRQESGEPWTRLALILGGVALFTAVSALLLARSRALRVRYGLETTP